MVPQSTRSSLLRSVLILAIAFQAVMIPAAQVRAQSDPVFDSSVNLLRSSLTLDRRGQFSTLLSALRQLKDPQLAPFFKELTLSEQRIMRSHGILGLAEISTDKQLDLKLLANVKDPAMQSEVIGAALDNELLSVANAKQVLGWKTIEMDAKVVIATHLLEKKEFNDVALLKSGTETDNLARKGIIALLLMELGDASGGEMLEAIDKSTDETRDRVRSLVLQTAFRFKFGVIKAWAAKVSSEQGINENLGLLALRTAMRFGHQPSIKQWTQQFATTTDTADRMRLALSLLNLAVYLEPAHFDPLLASTDPLIKQMGAAGKAVAVKSGAASEISKLIAMDYAIANAWAVGYATHHATPADATLILTDLVHSYEKGPAKTKVQRLDEAVIAAQLLCEKDPAAAAAVLKPILINEATDKHLTQGLLVAMFRANKGEPHKMVLDISQGYPDANANALRLLLMAKHDVALTPAQLKDLGLLVRGGGSLPDPLRLQAAWIYLKQTKQTTAALDKAMK